MIFDDISRLLDYGVRKNIITVEDTLYVRNRLLDALGLAEWEESEADAGEMTAEQLLTPLVDYAAERGIIADTAASRDLFDTRLMGLMMPMPREIIAKFEERYEISARDATDWYYMFSRDVNYVRAERIARDMRWTYDGEYGRLDISINRSKPEKDPRDIAAARNAKASGYPKCQLCLENTGFAGHLTHPARQNLVPVPITVGGERWSLQYSPYGYYNEHCIAFNNAHIPMKIDRAVFDKLFDIIEYLPHYFIGSNADLPIVGGSILSHEHFQGGRYSFAMERAEIEHSFEIAGYPNVTAGILRWPMSVIRLSSEDRDALADCCDRVLCAWRGYTDPEAYIFAETDGVPHNTVTPIARMSEGRYVCDLVLRNNITTEERPLGLYHPSPELHHIKKENIGLIEVMGLAVLPARLATEIGLMAEAVIGDRDFISDTRLAPHAEWLSRVVADHPEINADNVLDILKREIGVVFEQVLLDAGVFKRDEKGRTAFMRFISKIS